MCSPVIDIVKFPSQVEEEAEEAVEVAVEAREIHRLYQVSRAA